MDIFSTEDGDMDWAECMSRKIVKEISSDKHLVASLMEMASNKLKTQELLKMDDTTASSKVSLAYDALREYAEALAILKGFKVYNHECYCAFLKEKMQESDLGDLFDKQRKLRNAINYYGKKISPEEASSSLGKIIELSEEIKKLISLNINEQESSKRIK